MSYQVVEKDKIKYIRLTHSGSLIRTEADALERRRVLSPKYRNSRSNLAEICIVRHKMCRRTG